MNPPKKLPTNIPMNIAMHIPSNSLMEDAKSLPVTFDSKSVSRMSLRFLLIPALALSTLAIAGCESEEDRQLYGAQSCLDSAKDATQADVCVAKVQGNETAPAYLIRCSAHFIAQEFTGPRVASAFQRLKDNPSDGTDPMATMMAYLVFAKPAPAHTADLAIVDCQKSGLNSMLRMAQAAKLATFVAAQANGGAIPAGLDPSDPNSFNPDQIKTAIDTLVASNDPAKDEVVGTLAISMKDSYCGEDSSFKENEVCKNLLAAVGSGASAATIGHDLLVQLQTVNE